MRTLKLSRPSTKGPDVLYCQKRLVVHGMARCPVDGVFGTATLVYVRALQGMHNLNPTGQVDTATWEILTSKPVDAFPVVTGMRQGVIERCWNLIGVPYLHCSNNPQLGLDALGFLGNVFEPQHAWVDDSLDYIIASQFSPMPKNIVVPGDVAVYYHNYRATHALVVLNKRVGIGPLGGNASTTSVAMALKRKAFVKVKNINYRYHMTYSYKGMPGE